jgi:integrase
MPIIPRMKKRDKDKKVKRDDLTEKEWLEIEKVSRLYFIKGQSRILDEKTYKIEKNKSGTYKTRTTVSKISQRGRNNLTHRIMFYNAMRIAMDTGMRIGSLKQLKWKHIAITENSTLPKSEQKMYVSVNVPAENTKTGSSYRLTAPIAAYLNNIRRVVRRDLMKPNDLIFCNQTNGKMWSSRIWEDYLMEVLVEARLANWNPDMKRGQGNKKIIIHSGKNITFYSFRHTYITMRLKNGTPLAVVAANCNTSLKYIQDHYYHYRSDENIEQLMKGREKFIKPARGDLSWIEQVETEDFG